MLKAPVYNRSSQPNHLRLIINPLWKLTRPNGVNFSLRQNNHDSSFEVFFEILQKENLPLDIKNVWIGVTKNPSRIVSDKICYWGFEIAQNSSIASQWGQKCAPHADRRYFSFGEIYGLVDWWYPSQHLHSPSQQFTKHISAKQRILLQSAPMSRIV